MAGARQAAAWHHTAALLAMIHNSQAKKEDQKPPSHFNFYEKSKQGPADGGKLSFKQKLASIRPMFVPAEKPNG
jgi:hypothetical protein